MGVKINIYRIKKNLKKRNFLKFLENIAQHIIPTSLILFLLSLVLGGILFYKYVIFVQKKEFEVPQKESLIKENIYKEILKNWQEQEKRFDEADFKEYPNPFKRQTQLTPTP